jgi:hypothetical protein
MCLLGGFAGLGFAGQDSGTFFAAPEVRVGGLYWFVGSRGDGVVRLTSIFRIGNPGGDGLTTEGTEGHRGLRGLGS